MPIHSHRVLEVIVPPGAKPGCLLGVVTRPVGGALGLVSAASHALVTSVGASPEASPMRPPQWARGAARVSATQLERMLLPPHERHRCHANASPVAALCDTLHLLVLSSSTLYVLDGAAALTAAPLHAVPLHQLERLEATPPQAGSRGVLSVFLCPPEAHRLGVPSCLMYAMDADESLLLVALHEQVRLELAGRA